MDQFSLSERYRLELHWNKTFYEQEGRCKFEGAKFTGPVLNEAARLNDNDHIMIDFFSQYLYLVKGVYVAKFSWGRVNYNNDGSIGLDDAFLTHDTELNRVPKLKDTDYLVIDTSGHEVENHPFNLVYKTYVVNETTNLYKFGRE
jgi:hypothetical protein